MTQKRIKLIPAIHGKLTRDGKLSEPDIHAIMDRWLKRHPEMLGREREMRISRSRRRLANGVRTEVVMVSMDYARDMSDYDPAQDADLYEYYLAD